MKSSVFVVVILFFITIEKSHCYPACKNDTDFVEENNNTSVAENFNCEDLAVHELNLDVDNSTEVLVYENNTTDLTNNSSVTGTKSNKNTDSENNPPPKVEVPKKDEEKSADNRPTITLLKNVPVVGLTSKPSTAIKQEASIVPVTTKAPSTSTKSTLQEPTEISLKKEKIPDEPDELQTTLVETPEKQKPKPTQETKPVDKKTPQVETNDEKDFTGGDEEQPDLENLGVLQTDDKKESPAPKADENQSKSKAVQQVDSEDKKTGDTHLPRPVFPEQENSHFFVYFMTVVAICVLGYFLFHNKQKIIALIVEGRHDRRRRAHSYRKLENEGAKGSPAIF